MKDHQRKVKIFALPFAGGSKYCYRILQNFIPSQYEWETLELPGRGTRIQEPFMSDVQDTVDNILLQMQHRIHNVEYMIYGHSMGALLGYEVTKKIVSYGLNRPACLFLTGHGAPGIRESKKISGYKKEAFWLEVKKLGGLPQEILDNDELLDLFEPILRSDFKVLEEYKYQSIQHPLPVPLFVRIGDEENISREEAMGWQQETEYMLDLQVLPGNHFFIFKHPQYVVRQLMEAFTTARVMTFNKLSLGVDM